jgi:hypothetical protein
MALLTVLVIGGVSTAAERALPGEPLYQVKTSVNENVLGLFAFTPQSKAELHTELVVRRLEEVEKLAISGKLNASTTAEVETKINTNLAVIKDSVKQLETDNNSAAAAVTSSKAESTLKVHEAILDTLVDGTAVVNDAVQGIADKVGIQATALSLDRAGIDARSASTTVAIDVLIDQEKVAKDAVVSTQTAIASSTATSTEETLSKAFQMLPEERNDTLAVTDTDSGISTSTTEAEAKLKEASDILAQANTKLETKDYGEAFILFKQAEKVALEARVILDAGDGLGIVPILNSNQVSTSTLNISSTTPTTTQIVN